MILLAVTGPDGRWTIGVSDPNPIGWSLFAGYLLAGALAILAFARSRRLSGALAGVDAREASAQRLLSVLWLLAALLMLTLGPNKQLDLQTLVIQTGRDVSRAQGWYEHRARFQILFAKAVLLGTAAAGIGLTWYLRRVLLRSLLPVAGVGLVLAYAALRAAAFEKVPQLGGVNPHVWIVEGAGIALVIAGAVHALRAPPISAAASAIPPPRPRST